MWKIYYIMGKSSSGKDTIYKELMNKKDLKLKTIVGYTTRPKREGEIEGREYHFVDTTELMKLHDRGQIIEKRTYYTVHGQWHYFTVDDGQFNLKDNNYLLIGTLESFNKVKEYFGEEKVVPIYIEVDDGLRLERALKREKQEKNPRYTEMCRRFIADQEDFSEDNIKDSGIKKRYCNKTITDCIGEIVEDIFLYKDQAL